MARPELEVGPWRRQGAACRVAGRASERVSDRPLDSHALKGALKITAVLGECFRRSASPNGPHIEEPRSTGSLSSTGNVVFLHAIGAGEQQVADTMRNALHSLTSVGIVISSSNISDTTFE